MVKFVTVKVAPTDLKNGEIVIRRPDFLDEIAANSAKAPKRGVTGANHLRQIVDTIGIKYDPENTNSWSIRPHLYQGVPYTTNEDLSKIVVAMLETEHPAIFKKYVEYQINHLPPATELIYFETFGVPS